MANTGIGVMTEITFKFAFVGLSTLSISSSNEEKNNNTVITLT